MAVFIKEVILTAMLISAQMLVSVESTTQVTVTGSSVTLMCDIQGITLPGWRRVKNNDITVITQDGIEKINPAISRITYAAGLRDIVISDVVIDDSATYTCDKGTLLITHSILLEVRILPQPPVISSKVTINNNRVLGTQDQGLTLTCTSTGGYPAPTVKWYRGNTGGSPLTEISSGTLQPDNTMTVTLNYTFIPRRSDDKINYTCRSEFNTNPKSPSEKSVLMFLNLKPRVTSVTQTSIPHENQNRQFGQCETTGFRPSTSISVAWIYNGATTPYTGHPTVNADETYSLTAVFQRAITRQDNGKALTCSVNHDTLSTPLTKSVNVNVYFASTSVSMSGNIAGFVADGSRTLSLICKTTTSNPTSTINWKQGQLNLTDNRSPTDKNGMYGGKIRTQTQVVTPTRHMDGHIISCIASNVVNTQSPVTDQTTLNLTYNPIVTISTESEKEFKEGDTQTISLPCSAESKPSSNFTWYHNGNLVSQGSSSYNVFNYNLAPVNRTCYGTYKCRASNGIPPDDEADILVRILFKPLTVTISGNSNIIANGVNNLELTCTTGTSNPISDISWKINNIVTMSTASLSDVSGDYGGKIRRRKLKLTPTRDDDGHVISCSASNTLSNGSPATQTIILDLKYNPIIKPMADVTMVEDQPTTSLPCESSSRPPSTFTWFRGSIEVNQGNGTSTDNKNVYTINNVNRSQAGTYRCNAKNNVGTPDNKNVKLIVQYPPDVTATATATNTTTDSLAINVTCKAVGIPHNNYQYKPWVQTWPGYGEVAEWSQSSILTLTSLTYEHSGTYRCSASNGVKVYGTSTEYMDGTVTLLVRSYPIITSPKPFTGEKQKVTGDLNMNVHMEVKVYLNTKVNLKISCHRSVNGTRQPYEVGTIGTSSVDVKLRVFSHEITTQGMKVTVDILILNVADFGDYDIVISNEIGTTVWPIEIKRLGPPNPPVNVRVETVKQRSAVVKWIPGFHDGLNQTFVIQVSEDNTTRLNTSIFGGQSDSTEKMSNVIEFLRPSTTYYARMYAYNSKGQSQYTQMLFFTTEPIAIQISNTKSNCSTAGLVAAFIGGIAFTIMVIAAIFLVRRQRKLGKCTCLNVSNINVQHVEDTPRDQHAYLNMSSTGQTVEGTSIKEPDSDTNAATYETTMSSNPSEHVYTDLKASPQGACTPQTNMEMYENLNLQTSR